MLFAAGIFPLSYWHDPGRAAHIQSGSAETQQYVSVFDSNYVLSFSAAAYNPGKSAFPDPKKRHVGLDHSSCRYCTSKGNRKKGKDDRAAH